jgi:hypothetical protein
MIIAVLHPGEMGSAIARALNETVVRVPDERSARTARRAGEVVTLFDGAIVETRIVADASALKLTCAAWTKGSAALLLAAREAAEVYRA